MGKSETICIAENHHEVHTEIIIAAASDDVWRVLTDFASMPVWSPSFKGILGDFSDGAKVVTRFDLGDGEEEYSATLKLLEGLAFGWSEDYDGIRDNHVYRVEPIEGARTRFIQTDMFEGRADWATTVELAKQYLEQYVEFNDALKVECERRYPREQYKD